MQNRLKNYTSICWALRVRYLVYMNVNIKVHNTKDIFLTNHQILNLKVLLQIEKNAKIIVQIYGLLLVKLKILQYLTVQNYQQ